MADLSLNTKWSQVACGPLHGKTVTRVEDDDQSTTVPSDVLDGTVSDLSTWDTGNIEELSSCGVLSSAELRAARVQRLARASPQSSSGLAKAKAKAAKASAPCSQTAPVLRNARIAAAKSAAGQPPRPKSASAPASSIKAADSATLDDDCSTIAPSDSVESSANLSDLASSGVLTSAELRAARTQLSKAKAATPAVARPKSAITSPVVSQAKAEAPASQTHFKSREQAGTQMKCEFDKASREAIRDMGLWEYMPARNPVVTKSSAKGADWNIGFEDYEHSLGGVPDAKPVERPHKADELNRHLDKQSHEAIREMGLWENMPARNPVVTRETCKGADWNIGFEQYEHSLCGVPDSRPVERPPHADELNRRLDVQSREAIKEMGLWEHMPARNPVVTATSNKGASWHVGFGEYVHTLGGVPDSRPVERPHHADVLGRHLDKSSRETIKKMGLWEHSPANNPVVTKATNAGASWNAAFS